MGKSSHLRVVVMGVNHAPERSGIAPYTSRLAEGLAERGHHVQVFTSRPHYPEWRVPEEYRKAVTGLHGRVRVRRFRHYIPSRPTWFRRLLFELSFGLKVSAARWGRPDVVICVSPALFSSGLIALRARMSTRRPALGVIVQDLYSRGVAETGTGGRGLGRLATRLEGCVLGLFDGVAVIHERFKRQATDGLQVPENRVSVIRNWSHVRPAADFDVERFRASMGWGSETVVLHAGAMGVKQGLGNVVEAARVAADLKTPMRFVLLGNGSQRESLAQLAEGLENIEFRDQVDSETFSRALAAADMLLVNELTGVRDMAVPSKLTSYFSAGKPVIAATDPESATAEEVAAADAGVQVPAGDPLALVRAVADLTRDPSRAILMARRGQEYSKSHLAEEVALSKYGAWVDALAGRESPTTGDLRVPAQRNGSRVRPSRRPSIRV